MKIKKKLKENKKISSRTRELLLIIHDVVDIFSAVLNSKHRHTNPPIKHRPSTDNTEEAPWLNPTKKRVREWANPNIPGNDFFRSFPLDRVIISCSHQIEVSFRTKYLNRLPAQNRRLSTQNDLCRKPIPPNRMRCTQSANHVFVQNKLE